MTEATHPDLPREEDDKAWLTRPRLRRDPEPDLLADIRQGEVHPPCSPAVP